MVNAPNLDNSRPLDVHRWSDYPEVGQFFDAIHKRHFKSVTGKRHVQALKVLILDLYVCWAEDSRQYLAIPMSPKSYGAGSRFRSIFIDYKIIDLVHQAYERGLISKHTGSEWSKKVTRIKPTERLLKIFRRNDFDLSLHQSNAFRPHLIIRDQQKRDLPYWPAQAKGIESAFVFKATDELARYNGILQNTFIDIPAAHKNKIRVSQAGKKTTHIRISDYNKFVHRVFNNSSLTKGGRFFGGWWQNAPKDHRSQIFINNLPTSEIDFSSIHMNILYAWRGLQLEDIIGGADPYHIKVAGIKDPNLERKIGKNLMLTAINASDQKSCIMAFRKHLVDADLKQIIGDLSDNNLLPLLHQLLRKHSHIGDYICSGAGLDLMNVDAMIAARVVDECLNHKIVPLVIHDSFIIQQLEEPFVRNLMHRIYEETLNSFKITTKTNYDTKLTQHMFGGYETITKSNRYQLKYLKWKTNIQRRLTTITGKYCVDNIVYISDS